MLKADLIEPLFWKSIIILSMEENIGFVQKDIFFGLEKIFASKQHQCTSFLYNLHNTISVLMSEVYNHAFYVPWRNGLDLS